MIISEPMKSPLDILSFEIAHFKFASTGVLSLSRSWPYKHRPASNLKVSLAPKPINLDPLSINSLVSLSAKSFGIDISKPSSPV